MENNGNENFRYVYFLRSLKNAGDVRIRRILEVYKKAEMLESASDFELIRIEGINKVIIDGIRSEFRHKKEIYSAAEKMLEISEKKGIRTVTILDEDYPENLQNIYDPPPLLYYKGELKPEAKYSISIVGTRFPSDYGRKVCTDLARELSGLSIPIISGMATGIDSIAHQTALQEGNLTYAVLGGGIDRIYPPANKALSEKISECGALISEFDTGLQAERMNFPRRNRIISGMSLGTVIIESGMKGGSLITAEFAIDQNREVFAVPGNISSKKSEGCNNLIKKGAAKLVSSADDILSELSYKLRDFVGAKAKGRPARELPQMSVFETNIYIAVNGNEPLHIDKISEMTGLNISDCLVNLLMLEFKGLVSQLPGKFFTRR